MGYAVDKPYVKINQFGGYNELAVRNSQSANDIRNFRVNKLGELETRNAYTPFSLTALSADNLFSLNYFKRHDHTRKILALKLNQLFAYDVETDQWGSALNTFQPQPTMLDFVQLNYLAMISSYDIFGGTDYPEFWNGTDSAT